MRLQAVDDVGVAPEPLAQHAVSLGPDVDVAVVAATHDVLVALPQEGHPLDSAAVAVACIRDPC